MRAALVLLLLLFSLACGRLAPICQLAANELAALSLIVRTPNVLAASAEAPAD